MSVQAREGVVMVLIFRLQHDPEQWQNLASDLLSRGDVTHLKCSASSSGGFLFPGDLLLLNITSHPYVKQTCVNQLKLKQKHVLAIVQGVQGVSQAFYS